MVPVAQELQGCDGSEDTNSHHHWSYREAKGFISDGGRHGAGVAGDRVL